MGFGISLVIVFAMSAPGEAGEFARHDALALRGAAPNAVSLPCYGRLELTLDLKASFSNPFDPDDVDVYAEFRSPDGAAYRANGFYTQACTRALENGAERVSATGEPFWQIRFTPNKEGVWQYTVHAKDRSGSVELPAAKFTVTPSPNPGFVRRDAKSPNLFAFDNQRPFFAIGENMCWPASGPRGTYCYDYWLPELSKAGGNWIRIWMHRWFCCLEWGDKGKPDWETVTYGGLGYYNLVNAWKMDAVLDTAEKNNVYVMLCLGTYGEFIDGGYFNEGLWKHNPYNAANGGPCAKPEDFWTNDTARKLYRQRLRYIAARYGCRANLFGWEFWNEAYPTPAWVTEMAQLLKGTGPFDGHGADPYRHLVSTTYGTPDIWKIAEVDFTQSHHYGKGNLADSGPVIHEDAAKSAAFGKPHFMAEFGIDWRSSDDKYDPQFLGVNLHNGLWAAALSGNAGGAMIWYWDSYVHPGKLYSQFTPLRAFTDAIPWSEGPWKVLELDPVTVESAGGKETWRDLVLAPTGEWGKSTAGSFNITPREGAGGQTLPAFVYGESKPDLRAPLTFHVNYAAAGRFEVKVSTVSLSAQLLIELDGKRALDKTLSAVPPEKGGPAIEYQSTEFRPEYGIYQANFGKNYGIDVPAGEHTVVVEVMKGDWLGVEEYAFRGYVSSRYPNVNVYGITNGAKAYLWAQNGEHNWLNRRNGGAIPAIHGAKTIVHGLPDGQYACTWWDTWKGTKGAPEALIGKDGAVALTLPDLPTDAAASVEPKPAP
ncbi:MAG: DUF5060 domain-containing protein [Candidatus Hydrogenedentes bacterium]|nr:DUF5060 domain-containing protein [Candidatus Hydrogenedentota bacterium]